MKLLSCTRLYVLGLVFALSIWGVAPTLMAAPIPNSELVVTAAMDTAAAIGVTNSNFNPRHFAGSNFVLQINSNTSGLVRYDAGSEDAETVVVLHGEGTIGGESRMWSPMDGGTSTDWVLLAGGVNETRFSRLPYDAENTDDRIFAGPSGREPNSFDWVDNDTIIYTSYETPLRGNIYLADVAADPFTITTNITWNTAGMVTTGAGRIRNVRVGDVYNTHAYYAEAQTEYARVWALDLSSGTSTEVALIEEVTGTHSWGVFTTKEVDGYLYVHTTNDGVYVYEMEDATTVGNDVFMHYTQAELDTLMTEAGGAIPAGCWGFDVTNGGDLMLLAGKGMVLEISLTFDAADFDEDGDVDGDDLLVWQSGFGASSGAIHTQGDADDDGDVDGNDFLIWQRGPGGEASGAVAVNAVPEPAAVVLALAAFAFLMVHLSLRRR